MNYGEKLVEFAKMAGIKLTEQTGDMSHHQPSLNQAAKNTKTAPAKVGLSSVDYENDDSCPDIPARV